MGYTGGICLIVQMTPKEIVFMKGGVGKGGWGKFPMSIKKRARGKKRCKATFGWSERQNIRRELQQLGKGIIKQTTTEGIGVPLDIHV